ncbi:O166 family O-antigen polymerase [Escherichia coli]
MYHIAIALPLLFFVTGVFYRKLTNILVFFTILTIGTIVSFRDISVDRDSIVYFTVFNDLSNINSLYELWIFSLSYGQEIGFILLMKLFHLFGASYYVFRGCFEFLTLFFIWSFIKKTCDDLFYLIAFFIYISMFLYFRDFTQIRFSFSCVMALNSIYYRLKNNNSRSIAYFIAGLLVHNSILIIAPILLLIKFKFIYTAKFYFSSIVVALLLFKINIFGVLINTGYLPHQITRYINQDEMMGNTFGFTAIITIVVSFLMCLRFREYYGIDYKLLYLNMLFSSITALVFMNIPIMMRMQLLCLTAIIILPNVIYTYWIRKDSAIRLLLKIFFVSVCIIYYYSVLSTGIVSGYKTFFSI